MYLLLQTVPGRSMTSESPDVLLVFSASSFNPSIGVQVDVWYLCYGVDCVSNAAITDSLVSSDTSAAYPMQTR